MTDQATPEPTPEASTPEPKRELIPIDVLDVVPADPPRFYVHGDALHTTVVIDDVAVAIAVPLHVKSKHVAEIEDLGTALEQLQALAVLRGEDLAEQLDEMDIIDARELARKFFQAFTEKEQARLGESLRSSTS